MSSSNSIEISVVSPVYQAEHSVDELVARIVDAVSKITDSFEVVLVEDGSRDNSWTRVRAQCDQNPRVRGIKFSRNFGQHYAITSGLQAARGKYVVLLDCDLQDDPIYIERLLEQAKNGFDVVLTSKKRRAHSWFKTILSYCYAMVFNYLSQTPNSAHRPDVGTFSLLTRKVVDAFLQVSDQHRHYLMIVRWLGFRTAYVDVEHRERPFGRSSYSFQKMVRHALEGITSQSDRLLYLSINIGVLFFFSSVCSLVYLILGYIAHGYQPGWTSLMVVLLASTGLILMSLGVVGIYIGKIFEQSKGRPLYVVDERLNF